MHRQTVRYFSTQAINMAKKGKTPGFYGVQRGRKPGVYATWDEVRPLVEKFPGAVQKKFPTRAEAEAFSISVNGYGTVCVPNNKGSEAKANDLFRLDAADEAASATPSAPPPTAFPKPTASSAASSGGPVRLDRSLREKPYDRPREKRDYTKMGPPLGGSRDRPIPVSAPQRTSTAQLAAQMVALMKSKTPQTPPPRQPQPRPSEPPMAKSSPMDQEVSSRASLPRRSPRLAVLNDPQGPRVTYPVIEPARKRLPNEAELVAADGRQVIYTDGASKNNNKSYAKAGYGIYFGPNHKDNVSKPLPGPRQTNQRAELIAVLEACEIIMRRNDGKGYEIRTDSQYTINCVTKWYLKWRLNDWKTSNNTDVENKDLIRPTIAFLEKLGSRVKITKVKGHSGDPGNDAADFLATNGAKM